MNTGYKLSKGPCNSLADKTALNRGSYHLLSIILDKFLAFSKFQFP